MTFRSIFIGWLPIFCVVISGCTRQGGRSPESVIVTSILPLQNIVGQIGGKSFNIEVLVPAGANPHTYEPPPSVLRLLQGVKLFVGVHPEFDGWILPLLPPDTKILFLHPDYQTFNNHEHPAHDHEVEKDHEHGRIGDTPFNPHFWLSPRTVKRSLPAISRHLAELLPDSGIVFNQKASRFASRLDSLDLAIAGKFKDLSEKRFVQWHAAWDGFADDYDLNIIGTLHYGHGDEPALRSFGNLVKKARTHNVRIVVIGLNAESKTVLSFIREIDGKLIRLDTLGDPDNPDRSTYIRLLANNATILADALGNL